MQNATMQTILGVLTDFLASDPTPQEIIDYRLPPELEARAHDLLERHAEGQLTFDEQQEMYDFIRVDEMLSLLRAKTRLKLKKASE